MQTKLVVKNNLLHYTLENHVPVEDADKTDFNKTDFNKTNPDDTASIKKMFYMKSPDKLALLIDLKQGDKHYKDKHINARSVKIKEPEETIYVKWDKPSQKPYKFKQVGNSKDVYVYKSNLQKCVRRCLTDEAVKTGYIMLSTDPHTFFRRLSIIMFEDVLCHPSFINVIWYMMAVSKGYLLTLKDVEYLLGIVYLLTRIKVFDQVHFDSKILERDDKIFNGFSSDKKTFIDAIQFRKSYGGMHGDMVMLNYFSKLWYERFINKDKLWKKISSIEVPMVDVENLAPFTKKDIIIEAIDYHCYLWMIKKLLKAFPKFTDTEIKGAIWFYRSRINIRGITKGPEDIENLKMVYGVISYQVENLAFWIHNNLIDEPHLVVN